jgi:adenine-specific DNA methylase
MTHQRQPLPQHGYSHWWKMFGPRQLLVHTQLLRAICTVGKHTWDIREFVLGGFQQYLRNQNMFCFWDSGYDKLVPMLSNANFHPKAGFVENGVFGTLGRGNWLSCAESFGESLDWMREPWELAHVDDKSVAGLGKSAKIPCSDPVLNSCQIECCSATEMSSVKPSTMDLVITDPPFEGLVHYSELADFFYVWLRLVLKDRYPTLFEPEYSPKTLEVVENRARHPEDPIGFYK